MKWKWRDYFDFSGPAVATLFHRLLGLVFLDAWLSYAVQLNVLIGPRGLLPVASFLEHARSLSFWDFPTLLWISARPSVLWLGIVVGVVLSLAQLYARAPRILAAAQVVMYLSYATAGGDFFYFQWDNLILECAFCATFLPTKRRAFWIHTVFRLVLFKLYWESGLAKFQSENHDWRIGSAMALYYETAPLPTALAWYAHHMPLGWHKLESWATLAFELGVPFGIWGPRRVRQATAGILTGFQIINVATANYGFFSYLAVTLHVFLLDDADLVRFWNYSRLRLKLKLAPTTDNGPEPSRWRRRLRVAVAIVVGSFFLSVSTVDALITFAHDGMSETLYPLHHYYARLRLVNTYHLFGQITTERIEPEFQTSDGKSWTAHDLWHKPGDPMRRPDWVAPHQPRVDFSLWFYGLRPNRTPEYVDTLVRRLCNEPATVQTLFRAPLPAHPEAVRIAFWQYHFTTRAERAAAGAWWTRTLLGASNTLECANLPADSPD